MKEKKLDLTADLDIDFYNLHVECARQPILYKKWADLWADAVQNRDMLKEELDYTKSTLIVKIRKQLEVEVDKVTEAMVNSRVETHESVVTKKRELVEANGVVNRLAAAKSALEQRKSMLQIICELWSKEYWSDPRVSYKAQNQASGKMAETRSASQKESLNRDLKNRLKKRS